MTQRCLSLEMARLKLQIKYGHRRLMRNLRQEKYGPMCNVLRTAKEEIKSVGADRKYWLGGGDRALGVAINMLNNNEIIAVPTDTVYGFAVLAQSKFAIENLYGIKKRDKNKPLAICLSHLRDVKNWGVIDHIPNKMLENLLPGPTTIVLKCKRTSDAFLNPGMTNIGIRIPRSMFVRKVIDLLNEPLALTSANESGKPSSIVPEEFSDLWPYLGAVFNEIESSVGKASKSREGSTVIDLSHVGKYKILRDGVAIKQTVRTLKFYGLVEQGV